MPITESSALLAQDALRALARRLDEAAHGERGALVEEFMHGYGWSRQKVYRELARVGWTSGRVRRRDAGSTRQDETALMAMAGIMRASIRKNGKPTLHTPTARSVLGQNGHEFRVGNARLNTLLRTRGLDLATQRRDPACQPQRSLHPNHVHLVDPSLCLVYYLPDGGQEVIRDDEAYKNKPENIERLGDLKVWRYVLVDHYSCTVLVRYYQARGENQANLFDFLLYCWAKRDGRPFHGVPFYLYWDKGSANTAGAISNALRALQVETLVHLPGNPRAKGSVEWANNLVECEFESRLKLEPVRTVDELNEAAEAWSNAYCANAIPGYDSRLHRPGMREPMSRFGIWQRIRREQLRVLPDPDLCRYLLSSDPVERTVRPDLTVSFKHPGAGRTLHYDLRDLPDVRPRGKVRVSPLVYGAGQVLVYIEDYRGEERVFEVAPIAYDEVSGFRLDAPVIGAEHKRPPATGAERAAGEADRTAYPGLSDEQIQRAKAGNVAPLGGSLDAHSHLGCVAPPAYMDRPGTDLDVPDRAHVERKPLSVVRACRELRGRMGDRWRPEFFERVKRWHPDGVAEEALGELTKRLLDATGSPETDAPLKVVT